MIIISKLKQQRESDNNDDDNDDDDDGNKCSAWELFLHHDNNLTSSLISLLFADIKPDFYYIFTE